MYVKKNKKINGVKSIISEDLFFNVSSIIVKLIPKIYLFLSSLIVLRTFDV